MSIKSELKNIGYFLITPIPAKYHFEGVDNRRAAIQLGVGGLALQAAVFGLVVAAPVIEEAIWELKHQIKTRKMLNKYKNF